MTEKTLAGIVSLVGTVLLLIGPVGISFAQDEELHDDVIQFDEIRNLGSVSCRDVLLASGAARENLILVMHAYLLGEAKQLDFNAFELAAATDRLLDTCIAEPDAQALKTLREAVG